MTATETAQALLAGITEDRFTREVSDGWLYDVEFNPPQPSLGFAIGYDLCITLVSQCGEVREVFVCKPRPLAPVPSMFIKLKNDSIDGHEFDVSLLCLLEDIAKEEVEATLMEAVTAGMGTPGDWASLEPATA